MVSRTLVVNGAILAWLDGPSGTIEGTLLSSGGIRRRLSARPMLLSERTIRPRVAQVPTALMRHEGWHIHMREQLTGNTP